MNLDYFLKINNAHETTSKKETQLYYLKKQVNERFRDTIDWYVVKINNITRDLLIVRTNKQDEKTIKSRPNEDFNVGDYVEYDGKYWLAISKDDFNQVYTTGTMKLTNYTLKFQHPATGVILSYPCITTNRIQGTGDKETSTMTLPDGRKKVILPYDENTVLLQNSDSKTWRFFIDNHPITPRVYKLSFADTTSYPGLIELYCDESHDFNPLKDKVDLGVCDFEPFATPDPPDPKVPTEIVTIYSDDMTNNEIKLGIPYLFYATFHNEKGEDISDVIAEYSVDNIYDGKVVLFDNNDGTCTVTVGRYSDTGLVNKQFILTCTDIINNVSSSILLTIVGLY